jgi:anti-sigma regulatory factor (Ser/Thr protein kinase)
MNPMTLIRPTLQRKQRFPLAAGPAAAAAARSRVREAICAWDVPVDPSVAALLTSELVTNAIRYEPGGTISLVITCAYNQLHVDVHDTSPDLPMPVEGPVDAEAGRGLVLVASFSASWGYYRTATGKAVYFTLMFSDDPGTG